MRMFAVLLLLTSVSGFCQDKFDVTAAREFQNQLNKEYADPKKSPLMEQDLKAFHGLDFFEVNPDYIVTGRFVKSENEKPFEMKTTSSRRPKYVKYGEFHFEIQGKSYRLNAYRSVETTKSPGYENTLFLPFSDLTSGKETYIGGRYLDVEIPVTNTAVLDFNRAYNPYCAYNYAYSCPIVPLENDLEVAVRAGVKKFHD